MDELNNEEHEKMHLIRKESVADGSTDKLGDDDVTSTRAKSINLKEAFYVMTAFSIGTGILVMPYTLRQLGLLPWLLCITGMTLAFTACACLLWLSVQRLMEEDDIDVTRDAYFSLAQFSYGRVVRIFAVVFLFAGAFSAGIVFLLLSASILTDLLPIGTLSHGNCIRIWSVVIASILTPVMYLGNYSDVMLPAIVALVTSLMSAVAILVNCIIYDFSPPGELINGQHKHINKNIFVPIGTLIFALCGVPYTITNVTVLAATPQKLARCIVSSNICTYVIFLIIGLVPYLTFGENTLSSTISTFYQVIHSADGGGTAFKVITIVVQTLMLVHLTMANVLCMNPCLLYVEDFLGIAHEFNHKRVIIRTLSMMLILGIGILIPEFDFAISVAGGVPFAIITIFLPVIIYTKLFQLPVYQKILVFFFLLAVVVLVLGNFVVSVLDLIKR